MKTITVNIPKSKAVAEWIMKEWGSYEDHKESPDHAVGILFRCKGKVTLTETEAETLLKSGRYNASAWHDEEIEGGSVTKATISRICDRIQTALSK